MKFDLKSPCADCPFRKDVAFYLRADRRKEIADALLTGNETFACHKTVHYDEHWDDEGEYTNEGDEQHCGEALAVLKRSGHLFDNWRIRFAAILGLFDPDKIRLDAPVFDNMDQFVEGDLE